MTPLYRSALRMLAAGVSVEQLRDRWSPVGVSLEGILAALFRHGWLATSPGGGVRVTEAGHEALVREVELDALEREREEGMR